MSQKFGTRRQKAKEETRRLILEHAYALFEEKGYQKTTMRELASRAGVGLGTIFQHFPEKSILVVAAYEEDMDLETKKAFKKLPETDLLNQLLHFGRTFFTFYATRPQLFRVVLSEVFFSDPRTQQKIDSLVFDFWGRLEEIFEKAIDREELPPTTDTFTAVKAFWAFYSFTLYMGLRMPTFEVELQIEELRKLLTQYFAGLSH